MMCIHPFQEGKDSCEGNSFLRAFFFVINTLVPRTTIMQLSCLQTFVPPIEQTSFLPTSSMLLSSPHHPPYSSFLSPGRDTRWPARARRLDCDAVATAVPNGRGDGCLLSHESGALGLCPLPSCRNAWTSGLAYLRDLYPSLKPTNRFKVIKERLTDKQTDREAEQLCKLCFLRKAG